MGSGEGAPPLGQRGRAGIGFRQATAPGRREGPASLGLPRLVLEIEWWIERELYEGPVAEAITYPWPALEVRFSKLASRDQVRFVPTIDGTRFPVIDDAGAVGAGLASLLSDVDKSAFLEAAGRRRRSLRRGR